MKRTNALLLGLLMAPLVALPLLAGCAKPKTVTLAWLPNNSGDNEKVFRAAFDKVIAQVTGAQVQDRLTTDYNIALAALDSGDAQLAWFGPFEYMAGHAKNPHVVPLVVESGDSGSTQDALYHSRLLVKKGNEGLYKSGRRLLPRQDRRQESLLRLDKLDLGLQHAFCCDPRLLPWPG